MKHTSGLENTTVRARRDTNAKQLLIHLQSLLSSITKIQEEKEKQEEQSIICELWLQFPNWLVLTCSLFEELSEGIPCKKMNPRQAKNKIENDIATYGTSTNDK